jgi:hypothetical protein
MRKSLLVFFALLLPFLAARAQVPTAAEWNYSFIDKQAEVVRIFALETGNGPEIFVPSETGTHVWQVLRHDPATGDYQIQHVSTAISTGVMQVFQPAQVTGDATPELVVAYTDGTVGIYDTTTRALLSKLTLRRGFTCFLAHDLDGDGSQELVFSTANDMFVYDLQGQEKWRLTGVSGFQMVIGQMDSDPSLEIATTRGQVVDVEARALQWDFDSDWFPLALADIDGDGMEELLARGFYADIHAFDVDTKVQKWKSPSIGVYMNFLLANLDSDAEPEMLIAAGGLGAIQAMEISASGLTQKWALQHPDSLSITLSMAVGQLDSDAELEIVRTTRNTDLTGVRLRVTEIPSLEEEWVSAPLRGPFVGVCKGDVTGDRIPDYVFGSGQSGLEKGGRIQVVDSNTLHLTGVSGPVLDAKAGSEISDLSLCDVEGDGRFEIAVTGRSENEGFSGFAEIYRFDPVEGFERIWSAPDESLLAAGQRIEVLDVDGNGDLEIIVAGQGAGPAWNRGIMVLDFDTGIETWRSPGLPEGWSPSGPLSLTILDSDSDGRTEAVLGVGGSGFGVYDLGLREVEQTVDLPKLSCLATWAGKPGIVVGMNDGKVARFTKNGAGDYVGGSEVVFGTKSIEQILPAFGDSIFTVVQDGIRLHQPGGTVSWQTTALTGPLSHRLSPLRTIEGWELFTNTAFGGSGFPVASMNNQTVVDLFASGLLRESELEPAEATLLVTRHQAAPGALPVRLSLSGTALAGEDYQIAGATRAVDGFWELEIPANSASATVNLTLSDDSMPESTKTIDFVLADGIGYLAGPDRVAKLRIVDDEPVVGVFFTKSRVLEQNSVKTGEGTELVFQRQGDLSRPLKVPFTTSGTATRGKDLTKLKTFVTFNAGSDRIAIKLVAGRDVIAEGDETFIVSLSPMEGHGIKEGSSAAELVIEDLVNLVELVQATPTSKGLNLLLNRTGPLDLGLSMMVLERRTYADDRTKTFRRKVTFPKGIHEATVPIIGGKSDALIEWSLIDDGTFFPDGPATLVYDWTAGS